MQTKAWLAIRFVIVLRAGSGMASRFTSPLCEVRYEETFFGDESG